MFSTTDANGSMASVPQQDRPIAIAPAPTNIGSHDDETSSQTMPYTCQTCTRRKVKCDKQAPVCSTCRKTKLECFYQAPAPRRRKRKLSGGDDLNERVHRYERILHENGLLPSSNENTPTENNFVTPRMHEGEVSIRVNESATARVGKLVSNSGKSRYIDSNLWRQIGDDVMHQISDEEDDETAPVNVNGHLPSDPLTGSLLGASCVLLDFHPTYETAKILWKTYVTNVDPICRMLHAPSAGVLVDGAARNPGYISKTTECLLFAIYHFAIVSLSEEECFSMFKESQPTVLSRYRAATCQALVNASVLKTTEMQVLQAYVLYLLSTRNHYDPQTFWVLSGSSFRIAQRMGMHRDGEILGLPPFEVHMRRRLFWQLLPMDGIAAQIAGSGIGPQPDTWDTKQAYNWNEDQIYPGMTEKPEEQVGASDMIFCLARTQVGKFHARSRASIVDPLAQETEKDAILRHAAQLERDIDEMEDFLERKIVRYLDIVEPLHFLTMSICRGAMNVVRLRLKISLSRHLPLSESHLREVHRLAMRVVDYDVTVFSNPAMTKFKWHFRALFQHSALACALTSLHNSSILTPADIGTAWHKIEKLFGNHDEILTQRRALHVAIWRLTLKSWNASAHIAGITTVPPFISKISALIQADKVKRMRGDTSGPLTVDNDEGAENEVSPESQGILEGLQEDYGLHVGLDPATDSLDWMNWDQLLQDFQMRPIQVS